MSNLNKNKKAYFFIIDAFVGSTIIFLSLLIIFNSHYNTPKVQTNYQAAEDYATFLMNTNIEDLNNEYYSLLMDEKIITNSKNSLTEQVTQFYYNAEYLCDGDEACITANMTLATKFLKNITDPLIPAQYGFSYIINDSVKGNTIIYNRSIEKLQTSKVVIASKKVIFLQINSSTLFGPEMTEIKIWI